MKILSWNCRGLGKHSAVRALRQLVQLHHPSIVFLSKTKLQNSDFTHITNSFGNSLTNHFVVDCILSERNRRGGLAMFWTNDVKLNIIGFSENMIDCYVDCGNNVSSWRATGLYGFSKHHQKSRTCDLISNLYNSEQHDNWLIFGDFNLIFNSNEKQGAEMVIMIL
jgi:exonuclease III